MARHSVEWLMVEHGFQFIETGGGCTAYGSFPQGTAVWAYSEGSRPVTGCGAVLITDGNATAPTKVGAPVQVLIYGEGGIGEPEAAILFFPNLRAALRALVG